MKMKYDSHLIQKCFITLGNKYHKNVNRKSYEETLQKKK